MRVSIDVDRCQGHGRCYALAPGVFDSDDLGNGVELNGGIVPPEFEVAARLAVANCPENAIALDEGT